MNVNSSGRNGRTDFPSSSSGSWRDAFFRNFVREEAAENGADCRYEAHHPYGIGGVVARHNRGTLSSSSSLSSHDSGGASPGGGKLKPSFGSGIIARCLTVPSSIQNARKRPSRESVRHARDALLRGRYRASMPVISRGITGTNTIDHSNSGRAAKRAARSGGNANGNTGSKSENRNEEWDLAALSPSPSSSPFGTACDLRRATPPMAVPDALPPMGSSPVNSFEEPVTFPEPQEPLASSLKKTCVARSPKNTAKVHRVAFIEGPQETIGTSSSEDVEYLDALWYAPPDVERFRSEAAVRAALTDQTMRYVARSERTYNRSTGLTAPHVLKEYLSSPEEVIGVEQLLVVQKAAREGLQNHHRRALLREMERLQKNKEGTKEKGGAPVDMVTVLAQRLKSTSTIAAHMALERASFVRLMD